MASAFAGFGFVVATTVVFPNFSFRFTFLPASSSRSLAHFIPANVPEKMATKAAFKRVSDPPGTMRRKWTVL